MNHLPRFKKKHVFELKNPVSKVFWYSLSVKKFKIWKYFYKSLSIPQITVVQKLIFYPY